MARNDDEIKGIHPITELLLARDRIAKLEAERDLWANRAAGMLSMVPESTLCGEVRSGVADIRAEERERFGELVRAAKEIDAYLCENKLNQVGASSILHNKLRRGLKAIRNLSNPSSEGN